MNYVSIYKKLKMILPKLLLTIILNWSFFPMNHSRSSFGNIFLTSVVSLDILRSTLSAKWQFYDAHGIFALNSTL
jgi:hypothetical protein